MFSLSAANDDLHLSECHDGHFWLPGPCVRMPAPHRHAEVELNLVTAGRATYLLGDRRYELTRHTLVWLFPGQDHILLDESADYAMWIGVFKPALLARVCVSPSAAALRLPNPPGSWIRRLAPAVSERLAALFREVHEAREDAPRCNAGLGYALLSAWDAYGAAAEYAAGPDVHPAVERTARLLRDEAEAWTVEQIAARVGLSASRLSRLFHRQTGVTLVDFRNRQRLQRFLRLYGRGASMLDAALDAGFGSYPQFHRVFTRQMGCGPAEYRRGKSREGICKEGISGGGGEPAPNDPLQRRTPEHAEDTDCLANVHPAR